MAKTGMCMMSYHIFHVQTIDVYTVRFTYSTLSAMYLTILLALWLALYIANEVQAATPAYSII